MKTTVAVYDTKPYDRESLGEVRAGKGAIDWRFLEFRLGPGTAQAHTVGAGRLRVRERRSRPRGVGGARGAGGSLAGAAVYRLQQGGPARGEGTGAAGDASADYSPYSVAEHAVALILALNRKLHRRLRVRSGSTTSRSRGLRASTSTARPPASSARAGSGGMVAGLLKGFGMRV